MPHHSAQPLAARRAWVRLATLFSLAVLLWTISCRPAWSPDGSKLLFPARQGEGAASRAALAEYELESGKSRFLQRLPADAAGVAVWDEQGGRWVLVSAHSVEDSWMVVTTFGGDGEVRKQHDVKVGARNVLTMLGEPVVLGGHVFLMGKRAMRIDLDTGTDTGARSNVDVSSMFRLGDGLGYAHAAARARAAWTIGRLDPVSLEGTPLFTRPEDCKWQIAPYPSFNAKQDRCAVVAFQGEEGADLGEREWAILVLADGKIESSIPLGKGVAAGPLRWSPDNVTIYATIVRIGERHDTFTMAETDFSGSIRREVELVRQPIDEQLKKRGGAQATRLLPFGMQPSVSPNGRHVAFTTALLANLPKEQHGLLLIDTRDKEREVKRVPFPTW